MKKTILIAALCILLLAVIVSQGCTKQNSGSSRDSDVELVKRYYEDNGHKPLTDDIIDLLKSHDTAGKSDWDILVEYLKTGENPDGFIVRIHDDSIEIRTDDSE